MMSAEDREYWTNWISQYQPIDAPTGWDAVSIFDRIKLAGFEEYVDYDPRFVMSNDESSVSRCNDWYNLNKDRLSEFEIKNPCQTVPQGPQGLNETVYMIGNWGDPDTKYFLWGREVSKDVAELKEELYGNYISQKKSNALAMLAGVGILALA